MNVCSAVLNKAAIFPNLLSKIFEIENITYTTLEISSGKMTSNANVKWLITEFSRLYKPFLDRINIMGGKLIYQPQLNIWWEVCIYKGKVKFYLTIPDKNNLKDSISKQAIKTWKHARVQEVKDFMPTFNEDTTEISQLVLKYNRVASLEYRNTPFTPLNSIINTKHYLKEDDISVLQIGMQPIGSEWNDIAQRILQDYNKTNQLPRNSNSKLSLKEIYLSVMWGIGSLVEELSNLIGSFFVPNWEDTQEIYDSFNKQHGSADSLESKHKTRSEGFKTIIRTISSSKDPERRRAITLSMLSGFDPLEGDNKLEDIPITDTKVFGKRWVKTKIKEIEWITGRKMKIRFKNNVLCSLELAKMIEVPDQKTQAEHFNELNTVQHRGESDIPKEVFINDGGIPFASYEDTDGIWKTIYFNAKDKDSLCYPRIVIGEPGTGKTTFGVNFSLESFFKGFSSVYVDAADGKAIRRILSRIPTDKLDKVVILDFSNRKYPIGLGFNEIFKGKTSDEVEDAIAEEVLSFIELVSGTELNMTAATWVELACKAVFTSPDKTIQDVVKMMSEPSYRQQIIPTITDKELKADWIKYHEEYSVDERKNICDQAFRRLYKLVRNKTLRNIVYQTPAKDKNGGFLVDFRRWMDEGYLVLVQVNETLGEHIVTTIVSLIISKFNLAMISREDVYEEDDRKPCFLILDEPDHYIKGSERWRNMLTRYRKYRCGLIFMFHGWEQLREADKNLPKIIRKAASHYIIYQTDEDNLLELKSVLEPEFRIQDIAKGMPQRHAVIRLKLYSSSGGITPAFMAKMIDAPENRYTEYNNIGLYQKCSEKLGVDKDKIQDIIFNAPLPDICFDTKGEGELVIEEVDTDKKIRSDNKIQYEVNNYLERLAEKGEMDEEILEIMDGVLNDET